MENKERDELEEIILDEENCDNIFLVDENGKETEFEQVAVIPLEGFIFCILKPVGEFPVVGE